MDNCQFYLHQTRNHTWTGQSFRKDTYGKPDMWEKSRLLIPISRTSKTKQQEKKRNEMGVKTRSRTMKRFIKDSKKIQRETMQGKD